MLPVGKVLRRIVEAVAFVQKRPNARDRGSSRQRMDRVGRHFRGPSQISGQTVSDAWGASQIALKKRMLVESQRPGSNRVYPQ